MAKRWYVIRTNIKCEKRAKLGIAALGFEAFLPLEKRYAVRRGRRIDVATPLFGRYLFVEFNVDGDEWSSIRGVDGVESIISNNSRPVPVPAAVFDALRLGDKIGAFDKRKRGESVFAKGAAIEVVDGPFRDWIGKFVKARGADRVDILLNVLGSDRVVSVSLCDLREAG